MTTTTITTQHLPYAVLLFFILLNFKTIDLVSTCDNSPNGPVIKHSASVCATGKSNFKLCNVACLATKRLTSMK